MGIRDIVKSLSTTSTDLERNRLGDRFEALADEHNDIGECPLRCPVTVAGEVAGQRVVPRAGSPSLEVTVRDGTGTALVIFTGRRRVPGLSPGRGVLLEGVARTDRGRIVFVNPRYTLLP